MAQIRVTINKFGDTKIDVEGAHGTSCTDLTKGLETVLAGDAGPRNLKPEYDEPAGVGHEIQQETGW